MKVIFTRPVPDEYTISQFEVECDGIQFTDTSHNINIGKQLCLLNMKGEVKFCYGIESSTAGGTNITVGHEVLVEVKA